MNPSTKRRLISLFIITLLFMALMFGAAMLLLNAAKKNSEITPAQEEASRTAIENARKLDPNGEKIVLTEELLSTDYKIYYERSQSSAALLSKIPLLMFGVCALAGPIFTILKKRTRGQNITVLSFVPSIILLVVLVGASLFFSYAVKKRADSLPKPETATYNVYSMNILRKEAKKTKKRTGKKTKTTTNYYIYYEGNNGQTIEYKVSSTMYNQVGSPGIYYMAGAEENGTEEYYHIYDSAQYMPAAS